MAPLSAGNTPEPVAPHAGAWIETYIYDVTQRLGLEVAPHAGAWIETQYEDHILPTDMCRTPRGCVD